LFSFIERKLFGLKSNGGGFLNIRTKKDYYAIQKHFRCVAESNNIDHPINHLILLQKQTYFHNKTKQNNHYTGIQENISLFEKKFG